MRMLFKGVKIDNRTEEYIQKRIESATRFLKEPFRVEVEIELDKKGKFRVEIMVKTPHNLYRSAEISKSIEGSADIAVNEIKIQIKKDKDKRRTLIRRGGMSIKKKTAIDKNARF
jgi:ribosomal subunit interface protein